MSALFLLAIAGRAQRMERVLPPSALSGGPGRVSPAVSLPALTAAEITPTGRFGLPRVGKNRNLPSATLPGSWFLNGSGQRYWMASVRAQGAHGLRLHFRHFDVGAGQVWLHDGDPQNGQSFGPYSGRGIFGDGEFWTEMIFQDTVYVDYLPTDGPPGRAPHFELVELFHLWQDLAPKAAVNVGCFLDEQCYGGTASVAAFSKGVAYMVFSDHTCSGTLINDRNGSNTPYFLTAGHCIADQSEARSMLAVFDFRTDGCNGAAGFYNTYPQVSGANLLARNVHLVANGDLVSDTPDFAFTRLTGYPTAASTSLGWNFNPAAADRLTSISHPRNLPQRLAVGNIVDSSNAYFYTIRMNQGVVDHGASGSGIVNDSTQLVAVTSFVPNVPEVSACDITSRDYGYTRFDAIYPYIKGWLEAAAPAARATITSPVDGTTLGGSSATFTWTSPTGATGYSLSAGSQAGGTDFFNKDFGTSTSASATGLPVDGRVLYVRLTTRSAAGSASADYAYVAFKAAGNGPIVREVSSNASGVAVISPGSWVSAYGQNLGPLNGREWTSSDTVGGVLPQVLGGTRVTVNGRTAAISYASATQVNFQAPDDDTNGLVPVVITTAAGSSTPVYVTLHPVAVWLFQAALKSPAGAYVLATHVDGSLVLPAGSLADATPAAPEEIITLWGTGCGPSNPARASGFTIPATSLANPATVRIGGAATTVQYAGLTAPGICQFNVVVPAAQQGDQAVSVTISGTESQSPLMLAVAGSTAPGSNVWKGTGADAAANFGGQPYCNYQVTMTNLQLTANADQNLKITSAVLTGTMTETTLNGCPFPPNPQNNHTYTGTGTVVGSSISLALGPAITNQPQSSATFTGQIANDRLVGTLTITRTDQTGSLGWTMKAGVQ